MNNGLHQLVRRSCHQLLKFKGKGDVSLTRGRDVSLCVLFKRKFFTQNASLKSNNNKGSRVKQVYSLLFSPRYLFFTNVGLYMTLAAAGDCIQQNIERHAMKQDQPYDLHRTKRMFMYGSVAAPVNHFWYMGLDRFITQGSIHALVFKKLLADQLIFAPFFVVLFFSTMGTLEGQKLPEIKKEIFEKGLSVFLADCSIWPAAQLFNFYLVPNHLRLVYINFVTMGWNTFLSYTKHKESKA